MTSGEIFRPALARILSRYAGRVEAHFWGCRPPPPASGFPASGCPAALANVRHHGLICHYDRYLRRFSRAGYDIGLAPLPDDAFYRSKTNNKFREYGASGIAGIYSHVDVYADCVRHEVTGLLAANDADSWHDALVRLIEDETLRTRIQRQARQYVREHYAQEKFEQLFLEQIQAVLGTTASPAPARAAPSPPLAGRSAMLGFFRRLVGPLRRSLDVWRRLGPRRTWTALCWFVNNRCFAARLRWQLRRSPRDAACRHAQGLRRHPSSSASQPLG